MFKVQWSSHGKTYKKFFMDYNKAWSFYNSLYMDCLVVGDLISLNEK